METRRIRTKYLLWSGLLGGFIINLCDVTVTVTTVANQWNQVLQQQEIQPSALTPPYYIIASFIGGILLCWTLVNLSFRLGFNRLTALKASLLLWTISRLYGMGHVVMGQMPLGIFIIMSSGLLLGYVVAGQFIYAYLVRKWNSPISE